MSVSIRGLYRSNRIYIWCALTISLLLLTGYKLIYPYPNLVLDSYYYVLAAISHADISPWAIGYSWFLRLFGFFSHSPLALVVFQYLFLEISLLILFLSMAEIFKLSRVSKWIVFVFFFANPLLLYCANFVMADSLFISLSLLWISLLLWMIYRPERYWIWIHTILILLVFCVRYNALYYPVVATLAFLVSRYTWRQKILGIALQVVVIGAFIGYTSWRVGQLSGKAQFSPFGNWKTANDALYMYGHIYQEDSEPVPEKFAALHNLVRRYFKAVGKVDDLFNFRSQFYGSAYMFNAGTPLVIYKDLQYGQDSQFVNFKKMAGVGPLYGEYGAYLIRKHPGAFLEYFVEPNAIRYLFPPMEAFASFPPYFLRPDYLGEAPRSWFGLTTITVPWSSINLRARILRPYQTIVFFIHIFFVFSLVGLLGYRGIRSLTRVEQYSIAVLAALWICDMGFNLTAAATVMRYEIFLLMVEFSLLVWSLERIFISRKINQSPQ